MAFTWKTFPREIKSQIIVFDLNIVFFFFFNQKDSRIIKV